MEAGNNAIAMHIIRNEPVVLVAMYWLYSGRVYPPRALCKMSFLISLHGSLGHIMDFE